MLFKEILELCGPVDVWGPKQAHSVFFAWGRAALMRLEEHRRDESTEVGEVGQLSGK